MELNDFTVLLTPGGQEALHEAARREPREADFLQHFTYLSSKYPPGLARAALETAILRREAAVKFPASGRMYFTRAALEQASSSVVAAYRAARYRPFDCLVDLGCSIGSDSLALAAVAPMLGLELDPLRLAIAQANLQAANLESQSQLIRADLTRPLPLAANPKQALFFDPARRTDSRRIFSVREYQPPLEVVKDWLSGHPALGVKISPGVDLTELAGYEAEIEFISLHGELKEAVLWFGPLKTARRRATLLPGQHTLARSDVELSSTGSLPLAEPLAYLYEPDPAVIRAGLVEDLGRLLGAAQLDPDIAYLTAQQRHETPFARVWGVEAWFPFQLKRLRQALRERNVGQVTVKKRGSPLEPEALITRLHLSGPEKRVVFLTHLVGRPIVLLAFE